MHHQHSLYNMGRSRFLPTGPSQLASMGVGVGLYFRLTVSLDALLCFVVQFTSACVQRDFACLFTILALLSIPSLIVTSSGIFSRARHVFEKTQVF